MKVLLFFFLTFLTVNASCVIPTAHIIQCQWKVLHSRHEVKWTWLVPAWISLVKCPQLSQTSLNTIFYNLKTKKGDIHDNECPARRLHDIIMSHLTCHRLPHNISCIRSQVVKMWRIFYCTEHEQGETNSSHWTSSKTSEFQEFMYTRIILTDERR